jgi:hypothetical protein
MDSKKVIEQLIKIAEKQQRAIEKLAQALPPDSLPTSGISYVPGKDPTPPAAPPPTGAAPAAPSKREAETILTSLPANLKAVVANVEVHGSAVYITFQPGKASQAAFDGVKMLVQQLQNANKLPQQSYQVHAVG